MRRKLTDPDNQKLSYEIREIVDTAAKIETLGQKIAWENIGDPIAKGESVPEWVKSIIRKAASEDAAYAYSPTKGLAQTREFIVNQHNQTNTSAKLSPENILFFNGLGDAISSIYQHLSEQARVIGPDPSYPSHAACEAAGSSAGLLTYRLDPNNGWQIDTDDLEARLEESKDITGILLVNPGNPTGAVFTKETLEAVVRLADVYDCFIIADAIYEKLRFVDAPKTKLTDVLGDVPAVVMRGLSKEVPWPGARCGWLEFYNLQDREFAQFKRELEETKMQEVCSTTLPQLVLPEILSDRRFSQHLQERREKYQRRAETALAAFRTIPDVTAVTPRGAFYLSVVFDEDVLSDTQELAVDSPAVAEVIEPHLKDASPDKRFVYYLLAAEGICVVPLSSGFHSRHYGFRMTLLEEDSETFRDTAQRIAQAVDRYINS